MKQLLVVEDDDTKWKHIHDALVSVVGKEVAVSRVRSVVEADAFLDETEVTALVLDVSMNVASGASVNRGAQANLGGVEIAERLWLLGREVPTVVVTGFDYFRKTSKTSKSLDLYSLDDLQRRLKAFMGPLLVGCIKYGGAGWESAFQAALKKAVR